MKKLISIITNSLLAFIGILLIVGRFHVEYHTLNGIYGLRELTLNQDVTITSYDKDSSITFEKGAVISSDMILEEGLLYSEDINGEYYYEYIPLDCFIEGKELKAEIDMAIGEQQILKQEKTRDATIKILCFSSIYLVMAVPATIIPIKKKRYLVSILINIIIVLGVLIICSVIR